MSSPCWFLFYGDGSVLSSDDGADPFHVPRTNVQVIVQEDKDTPSGWAISFGKDYYYWQDGEGWWPTDHAGLRAWHEKCPPGREHTLWGENCPQFRDILKRAIALKHELIGSAA